LAACRVKVEPPGVVQAGSLLRRRVLEPGVCTSGTPPMVKPVPV
jgi:hypothetical protein